MNTTGYDLEIAVDVLNAMHGDKAAKRRWYAYTYVKCPKCDASLKQPCFRTVDYDGRYHKERLVLAALLVD